jgi:hypothetical protein
VSFRNFEIIYTKCQFSGIYRPTTGRCVQTQITDLCYYLFLIPVTPSIQMEAFRGLVHHKFFLKLLTSDFFMVY